MVHIIRFGQTHLTNCRVSYASSSSSKVRILCKFVLCLIKLITFFYLIPMCDSSKVLYAPLLHKSISLKAYQSCSLIRPRRHRPQSWASQFLNLLNKKKRNPPIILQMGKRLRGCWQRVFQVWGGHLISSNFTLFGYVLLSSQLPK